MIDVSPKATKMIKYHLKQMKKATNHPLRISVIGGGCSGLRYDLAFDDKIDEEKDHIITDGEIRIVVDEKSALYLTGISLDYADSLMETGFKIDNPNAATTCGCGESFGA